MNEVASKLTTADIHFLQNEAAKRTNADPLPGPAGDAFAKYGPIKITDALSVRPVVASDWKVFKTLDSPILKMLQELRQNPTNPQMVDVTDLEEYMLALQFTRTPKEVRKILEGGVDAFKEAAQDLIGDGIDDPLVKLIQIAIVEQVKRSWVTAVSYATALEEKGEVHFFPVNGTTHQATG